MRNITGTERGRQTAGHANYYVRVETKDASLNWRDLTNFLGQDYVDGVTWTASVDSPVMTGTVTLKRQMASGTSISPLLSTSSPNNVLGFYAPLLDVGRAIRISTATTAPGVAPVSGDWKEVFLGLITDIDFANDPITLTIADLGEAFVDTIIENVFTYGDAAGVPVESVMQNIIDDNAGAGLFTVFVPVSPDFDIVSTPAATYSPDRGPMMDALTALALQIGWVFRFHYDSSDVFRPTLFSPDRAKTTPDAIIGPDEYLAVHRLSISNADIKNVCRVRYFDKQANIVVSAEPVEDAGSIAEFGRRYMEIGYGSSNQIDTEAEAVAMETAAVSDLADPAADQEIEQFYLWQVDLGDLLQYTANGVHYNADQKFGVVSYTHTLSANTHRTTIQARGQVAGAFKQWLLTRNGEFPGVLTVGPAPIIFPLQAEAGPAFEDATREGMAWQEVRFEKLAASIEIYGVENAVGGPGSSAPIPELSATRLCYSLKRQEGDKWSADDQTFIAAIATRTNYWRKTISLGVGYDGSRGATVVWETQAVDVGTPPSGPPTAFTVAQTGNTNSLNWTVGDAAAFTILFRNGYGLVLEPGVNNFVDTGINTSIDYSYKICHWRNGQSSAFAGLVTAPSPSSSPSAPQWQAGYPQSVGSGATSGVDYRWSVDPATTNVAIELSGFLLIAQWFTVASGGLAIPTGSYVDTTRNAGSQWQARVRATVGGREYYSAPASVTYGIQLATPVFVNGTPVRIVDNPIGPVTHLHVEWTLASTLAVSLEVYSITQSFGLGPVKTLITTITSPSFIQSGFYDIPGTASAVQLRAVYGADPSGVIPTRSTAITPVVIAP